LFNIVRWHVGYACTLKDAFVLAGYQPHGGYSAHRAEKNLPIMTFCSALSGKVGFIIRARSDRDAYRYIRLLGFAQPRFSFSMSIVIKRARKSVNKMNTPPANRTISKPPDIAFPLTIAFWDLQVRKDPIARV